MTVQCVKQYNNVSDGLVIFLALVGFALILGGMGYHDYTVGKESLSWPKTLGEITHSQVDKRNSDNKTHYYTFVNYDFSVNGYAFRGSHITTMDTSHKTRSKAERILSKYPTGAQVSVSYKPADPYISLLEPGIKMNAYIMLGIAGTCLFFALVVFLNLLRKLSQM